MPNPRFIFHNKIPKCGSSTMSNVLLTLQHINTFKLNHLRPCLEDGDCIKSQTDGRGHSGTDF
jgi:dermatan/chondrotin sulfate uronyl 2-O-sulfotransferase UST